LREGVLKKKVWGRLLRFIFGQDCRGKSEPKWVSRQRKGRGSGEEGRRHEVKPEEMEGHAGRSKT